MRAGRPLDAARAFTLALRLAPRRPALRAARAEACAAVGRYAQAAVDCAAALAVDGGLLDAYSRGVHALRLLGRLAAAAALARRGEAACHAAPPTATHEAQRVRGELELDSVAIRYAQACLRRGEEAFRAGRAREAGLYARRVLRTCPWSREALLLRMRALLAQGRFRRCAAVAERVAPRLRMLRYRAALCASVEEGEACAAGRSGVPLSGKRVTAAQRDAVARVDDGDRGGVAAAEAAADAAWNDSDVEDSGSEREEEIGQSPATEAAAAGSPSTPRRRRGRGKQTLSGVAVDEMCIARAQSAHAKDTAAAAAAAMPALFSASASEAAFGRAIAGCVVCPVDESSVPAPRRSQDAKRYPWETRGSPRRGASSSSSDDDEHEGDDAAFAGTARHVKTSANRIRFRRRWRMLRGASLAHAARKADDDALRGRAGSVAELGARWRYQGGSGGDGSRAASEVNLTSPPRPRCSAASRLLRDPVPDAVSVQPAQWCVAPTASEAWWTQPLGCGEHAVASAQSGPWLGIAQWPAACRPWAGQSATQNGTEGPEEWLAQRLASLGSACESLRAQRQQRRQRHGVESSDSEDGDASPDDADAAAEAEDEEEEVGHSGVPDSRTPRSRLAEARAVITSGWETDAELALLYATAVHKGSAKGSHQPLVHAVLRGVLVAASRARQGRALHEQAAQWARRLLRNASARKPCPVALDGTALAVAESIAAGDVPGASLASAVCPTAAPSQRQADEAEMMLDSANAMRRQRVRALHTFSRGNFTLARRRFEELASLASSHAACAALARSNMAAAALAEGRPREAAATCAAALTRRSGVPADSAIGVKLLGRQSRAWRAAGETGQEVESCRSWLAAAQRRHGRMNRQAKALQETVERARSRYLACVAGAGSVAAGEVLAEAVASERERAASAAAAAAEGMEQARTALHDANARRAAERRAAEKREADRRKAARREAERRRQEQRAHARAQQARRDRYGGGFNGFDGFGGVGGGFGGGGFRYGFAESDSDDDPFGGPPPRGGGRSHRSQYSDRAATARTAPEGGCHYEVLGVVASASAGEVRKAYHRLARQYHPDKTGGDEASAEKFKRILEAYEVLSDVRERQKYDLARPL